MLQKTIIDSLTDDSESQSIQKSDKDCNFSSSEEEHEEWHSLRPGNFCGVKVFGKTGISAGFSIIGVLKIVYPLYVVNEKYDCTIKIVI